MSLVTSPSIVRVFGEPHGLASGRSCPRVLLARALLPVRFEVNCSRARVRSRTCPGCPTKTGSSPASSFTVWSVLVCSKSPRGHAVVQAPASCACQFTSSSETVLLALSQRSLLESLLSLPPPSNRSPFASWCGRRRAMKCGFRDGTRM